MELKLIMMKGFRIKLKCRYSGKTILEVCMGMIEMCQKCRNKTNIANIIVQEKWWKEVINTARMLINWKVETADSITGETLK